MRTKTSVLTVAFLTTAIGGCAYFNTFFNANKALENGLQTMKRAREQSENQAQMNREITLDRFSLEGLTIPDDARRFFDIAIEKGNKVVVLHPKSKWVEDAILLIGKAHYLRASTNDYYDAKNRFEVFAARYPNSRYVPEARLWYGKTLIKLRQDQDAQEVLRQIPLISGNPNLHAESLIYLGDLSASHGRLEPAYQHFSQAAALKCRSNVKRTALFKAGFCAFEMGDFQQAATLFESLRRMELSAAERFDVTFMIARCRKFQGEYDAAIEELDRLLGDLRYKMFYVHAEFEIGEILRLQKKYNDACTQFLHVINKYRNPVLSGDAYYWLGSMHDTTSISDGFVPDRLLARKYYQIASTKYPQSRFRGQAASRLNLLLRMDYFRSLVMTDRYLLDYLRARLEQPDMSAPDSVSLAAFGITGLDSVLRLGLTMESGPYPDSTVADSAEGSPFTGRGAPRSGETLATKKIDSDEPKSASAVDLASTHLTNEDLQGRLRWFRDALRSTIRIVSPDTLAQVERSMADSLAADYLRIADFFYYDQALYDSALSYYEDIAADFGATSYGEEAHYGIARTHQKLRSASYRHFYEEALAKHPDGRLAPLARRILGLEVEHKDPWRTRFEDAERLLHGQGLYDQALALYRSIAMDSSAYKIPSLYAMGWLYEKKLGDPDRAFSLYTTLKLAAPLSVFAERVSPKIDAYQRFHGISRDSLVSFIDTSFVRMDQLILPAPRKEREGKPSAGVDTVTAGTLPDSLETALPDSLLRHILEDSTSVDETMDDLKQEDGGHD